MTAALKYVSVRQVPLEELQRFPGNARRNNLEELRASIRRFGQYKALLVRSQEDGKLVILAGNHTADALLAEGHIKARCEIIKCTDDEALRINVADNRLADLGDYDNVSLVAQLNELAGDLEGLGIDDDYLDKLYRQVEGAEGGRDPNVEWQGMPEYEQGNKMGAFQVVVHFATHQDADDFFALINRPRKSHMWWPQHDGHPPSGMDHVVVSDA